MNPLKPTTVICDSRKLKRIAITCKCGERFTELVPGEVLEGTMVPVLSCQCGQQYVIREGKLQRVPDLKSLIDPTIPLAPEVEAEEDHPLVTARPACRLCGGPIHRDGSSCSQCGTPVVSDAWPQPVSKAVN